MAPGIFTSSNHPGEVQAVKAEKVILNLTKKNIYIWQTVGTTALLNIEV
jgi:hypothetical protein